MLVVLELFVEKEAQKIQTSKNCWASIDVMRDNTSMHQYTKLVDNPGLNPNCKQLVLKKYSYLVSIRCSRILLRMEARAIVR